MIAALSGVAVDPVALYDALKSGANPDRAVNGIPVLHLAIYRQSLEAFRTLLAFGAEMEDAVDNQGLNAVDALYKTGWTQGLLETDASIFKLHGKIYQKSTGITETSTDKSPDISTYQHRLNQEWKSAIFDDAYEGYNFWRVRTLLALGADVNAEDEDNGITPLRCAITVVSPEICHILVKAGAATEDPSTALHLWNLLAPQQTFEPRWFWFACYDVLAEVNGMPFFLPRPDGMTLDEMRAPFPDNKSGSFLHFFAEKWCFSMVTERLKHHPEERLYPEELYVPRADGKTIIDLAGELGCIHFYDISIWRENFSALAAFRADMIKRGWHEGACENLYLDVSAQSLLLAREKLRKTGNRFKMKPSAPS